MSVKYIYISYMSLLIVIGDFFQCLILMKVWIGTSVSVFFSSYMSRHFSLFFIFPPYVSLLFIFKHPSFPYSWFFNSIFHTSLFCGPFFCIFFFFLLFTPSRIYNVKTFNFYDTKRFTTQTYRHITRSQLYIL